jgi:arsenate reductase (glutaredoxin)
MDQAPAQVTKMQKLEVAGNKITLRYVRGKPLTAADLAEFFVKLCDRLQDRTTNGYRALNASLKNSEANAQILSKPKVIARPVIGDDDRFNLGWTIKVQKTLLAD